MYEEKLLIEKGEKNYVKTTPHRGDLEMIKRQIRDAKQRADFVIFNLHTHEGIAENWYADEAAEFFQQAAREIIDAGADVVVGHGAHFLRTVENYHGKPIFYNLGSFLMEFEAGESIIPPEMYAAYDLPVNSTPADLHTMRSVDQQGKFVGFNADTIFSEGLLVQIELTAEGPHYYLYPLDLRMQDARNLNRGVPVMAAPKMAEQIITRLQKLNGNFDQQFHYDFTTHKLHLKQSKRSSEIFAGPFWLSR